MSRDCPERLANGVDYTAMTIRVGTWFILWAFTSRSFHMVATSAHPTDHPTKVITVRLPANMLEAVKSAGHDDGQSMNEWCLRLLERELVARAIEETGEWRGMR